MSELICRLNFVHYICMFIICEHSYKVNMIMTNNIVNRVLEHLNAMIGNENIVVEKNAVFGFDGTIRLKGIEFLYTSKNIVTNSNFGSVQKELMELQERTEKAILFIVGSIYPTLAKELVENGFYYIDAAGNCDIRAEDVLLYVEGKKNANNGIANNHKMKGRLFQVAGLKIVFELLNNPGLIQQPYREIQQVTGVSLGSINIVMKELENSNFLVSSEKGKLLKNKKQLLDRWAIGYNETLKPKLLKNRMTFKNEEIRREWSQITLPTETHWSGEPGASIKSGYLLPEIFTIYSNRNVGELVKAGFRPKDDGEIFVYQKFWIDISVQKTVPPLLIYADLMGSGISRNIETAQIILENELQHIK